MAENTLLQALSNVRRRLLGVSITSGVGWGLAAAVVVLVLCAWLDLALDLPPGIRVACSLAALACGVALIGWVAAVALRESNRAALARRLDRVSGSGGQILSGVDLFHQYGGGGASIVGGGRVAPILASAAVQPPGALSGALARMAVERAAALAANVRAAAAVPGRPLVWPMTVVALLGCGLGLLGLVAPRLTATQWARFTDPYGDHPPYSSIEFNVEPGDTRVLYGNALDVRVTARGGPVEQVDLVLLPTDGAATASAAGGASAQSNAAAEMLPMFPEPGGTWRASVADITTAGRYFVRARSARSRQFSYDLITVPELRDVKFRVTPPAYTRRPPYEGPLPQGGLAGLPGTKVELWAKSNRPLAGGMLQFTPAEAPAAAPATQPATTQPATTQPAAGATTRQAVAAAALQAPQQVVLTPTAAGASDVTGSFVITQPGKVEVKVRDVSGQESRDAFTASVGLLHDDRPFVRVLEPKPNSYATPDVTLNVQLLAEDDYGITRVQLFRSLNDSRPRAIDAPVPPTPPTRLPVTVPLPLAEYGLEPGDVIRLFARVEDNDPAGPKGSESSIVTVQIISREDLNRMTLAREGLEVLESKYEQARRRLEALDNEIQKQQKELARLDPNSELAKETQKKLEGLAKQVLDAADEIARNAGEDLPFDIDRKLRQSLYDLAADVREAGKKFDHDAAQLGLSASAAGKSLDDLRKRLGTKREEFEKEATDPLNYLAKVFPLKEDEARFTDLYLRQRDLAERMEALRGESAGKDDPKVKSRMRDLETEQRQLRDELRGLLDDIDNHVQGLPADPKLDDLRKQAEKFSRAVRDSMAADQMQSSESALSDFNGPAAAGKSKDAADTLAKFIGQCKGMGDQAGECLGFQPKLSAGLGNTVDQLLECEGLLPNRGKGNGMGAGGGYSARRSTLNNVGLYGSLPRMSQKPSRSGGSDKTQTGAVTGSGDQPPDASDPSGLNGKGRLKAAGESGANVPAQYRKKVGEYFQRVADELGE